MITLYIKYCLCDCLNKALRPYLNQAYSQISSYAVYCISMNSLFRLFITENRYLYKRYVNVEKYCLLRWHWLVVSLFYPVADYTYGFNKALLLVIVVVCDCQCIAGSLDEQIHRMSEIYYKLLLSKCYFVLLCFICLLISISPARHFLTF